MNILYSILTSIFAGIVVWFISPVIEPLQGDLRLGVALSTAFIILLVAIVAFRWGANSSHPTGAVNSMLKARSRVASEIKGGRNVSVYVDGVEMSSNNESDVASNIDAGESASIKIKNVKKSF